MGYKRITKRCLETPEGFEADITKGQRKGIPPLGQRVPMKKGLHWAMPLREILRHWEITQKNKNRESSGYRQNRGLTMGKIQKWEIAKKDRIKERPGEALDRMLDMAPWLVPPWILI